MLWAGVDTGLPLQFHVGFGDSDIVMHRYDPSKMTGFLHATVDTGASVMLLHCYPFIREAGYLAEVYPHVYFDTGASVHYTGASCQALIAQSLELAPFAKLAVLLRRVRPGRAVPPGRAAVAARHRRDHVRLGRAGRDQRPDAARYLHAIAHGNVERVYGLGNA